MPNIRGFSRLAAAAESALLKNWSEGGRLVGHLQRRRLWNLCHSFEWSCGLNEGALSHERGQSTRKAVVYVLTGILVYALFQENEIQNQRKRPDYESCLQLSLVTFWQVSLYTVFRTEIEK